MDTERFLDFYEEVNKLKSVRRTGWVERGVKEPETSSDHSFFVALLALVLGKERHLDMEKLLKMALVHDIAECRAGDIISKKSWPEGGSHTEEEKHALEKRELKELVGHLPPETGSEIMCLWLEFEDGKTREAAFVRAVDKLETILQALGYKKKGNHRKPLEPFWDKHGLGLVEDEGLKNLALKAIKRMQ